MGGVPATTGAWISAALASGAQVTASIDPTVPAMSGAPYDSVAGYSSFGPTPDGRIKPDIVAPGFLLSAATDKQLAGVGACGTSSATRIQQVISRPSTCFTGLRCQCCPAYLPPLIVDMENAWTDGHDFASLLYACRVHPWRLQWWREVLRWCVLTSWGATTHPQPQVLRTLQGPSRLVGHWSRRCSSMEQRSCAAVCQCRT